MEAVRGRRTDSKEGGREETTLVRPCSGGTGPHETLSVSLINCCIVLYDLFKRFREE